MAFWHKIQLVKHMRLFHRKSEMFWKSCGIFPAETFFLCFRPTWTFLSVFFTKRLISSPFSPKFVWKVCPFTMKIHKTRFFHNFVRHKIVSLSEYEWMVQTHVHALFSLLIKWTRKSFAQWRGNFLVTTLRFVRAFWEEIICVIKSKKMVTAHDCRVHKSIWSTTSRTSASGHSHHCSILVVSKIERIDTPSADWKCFKKNKWTHLKIWDPSAFLHASSYIICLGQDLHVVIIITKWETGSTFLAKKNRASQLNESTMANLSWHGRIDLEQHFHFVRELSCWRKCSFFFSRSLESKCTTLLEHTYV